MKDVISRLAVSQDRRDEQLNIVLAQKIAASNDKEAIRELIHLLSHKNRNIRNDAIKVVYEAAELKPKLVSPYFKELLPLLNHKDNRMVWGVMHALDAITPERPGEIFNSLGVIEKALDCGSVIARDHYVKMLAKLSAGKKLATSTIPLLIEQVKSCPVNQLPMYAEFAAEVMPASEKKNFEKAIMSRMKDAEPFPPKLKRLQKVLNQLAKL